VFSFPAVAGLPASVLPVRYGYSFWQTLLALNTQPPFRPGLWCLLLRSPYPRSTSLKTVKSSGRFGGSRTGSAWRPRQCSRAYKNAPPTGWFWKRAVADGGCSS